MLTTVLLAPGQVRVCELILVVAYLKIAPCLVAKGLMWEVGESKVKAFNILG